MKKESVTIKYVTIKYVNFFLYLKSAAPVQDEPVVPPPGAVRLPSHCLLCGGAAGLGAL